LFVSTAIVAGSLGAIAKQDGLSLAESFLSADIIILVDVSGSMGTADSRGGRTRYAVACDELARLQEANPGKLAIVAFASVPTFCPAGTPPSPTGGTDLAGALRFVSPADGTVRFIVVSDGCPNNEVEALKIARTFESRIDCIYTGPDHDRAGALFLQSLANAAGGRYAVAAKAAELASTVQTMMLKAG
jgi:Mg-chelatase subunit ChlD